MTFSYLDLLITAGIVGIVLWSAHRLGQANPVGTGRLAKRMDALELKVAAQGETIAGIEKAVVLLSESSQQTANNIAALRIETAGDRGTTERTCSAVERLEGFFIQEAFRGRAER